MDTRPRIFVCAWNHHETGQIPSLVKNAGCAADFYFREDGNLAPSFDQLSHDGLVILGDGEKHADNETFYAREMSWVRAALNTGKAVLGICHGAQLLAHVHGGKLNYGKTFADRGLTKLQITEQGKKDPLLGQLRQESEAAQYHYDTFELPDGSVDLARSSNVKRPHSDGFRIGRNVYGLQFHPEPTSAMLVHDGWGRRQIDDHLATKAEQAGQVILRAWIRIACRLS